MNTEVESKGRLTLRSRLTCPQSYIIYSCSPGVRGTEIHQSNYFLKGSEPVHPAFLGTTCTQIAEVIRQSGHSCLTLEGVLDKAGPYADSLVPPPHSGGIPYQC